MALTLKRFFRRKLKGTALVRARFETLRHSIELSGPLVKLGVAQVADLCWRIFRAKFPEMETFLQLCHGEKRKVLDEFAALAEKTEDDESKGLAPSGATYGASLFVMYITALAHGDAADLVNHIADFIEPYSRLGFEVQQSARDA
ncbi:MAG: hypothetical protein CVT72_12935 [Alphaproteobacteria bacterium HGW-Alphaproteobacteria-11]|nr:MAG: hypothetical protein CVT72_12935 [Alphaproteobacteria bacterium HGW-Alphaproteobacteria-11]